MTINIKSVQSFINASGVKSILQTKPQAFKGVVNPAKLKLSSLTDDIMTTQNNSFEKFIQSPKSESSFEKFLMNIKDKTITEIHYKKYLNMLKEFKVSSNGFKKEFDQLVKKYEDQTRAYLERHLPKFESNQKELINFKNLDSEIVQSFNTDVQKYGIKSHAEFSKLPIVEQLKIYKNMKKETCIDSMICFDFNTKSLLKKYDEFIPNYEIALKQLKSTQTPLLETEGFRQLLKRYNYDKLNVEELPLVLINEYGKFFDNAKLPKEVTEILESYLALPIIKQMKQKGINILDYTKTQQLFQKLLKDTKLEKIYEKAGFNNYIKSSTEKDILFGHYSTNRENVIRNGFDLTYCQRFDNRIGTGLYAGNFNSPKLAMYRQNSDIIKFKLDKSAKIGLIETPQDLSEIEALFDSTILPKVSNYAIKQKLSNQEYIALLGRAKANIYNKFDAVICPENIVGTVIFNPKLINIIP